MAKARVVQAAELTEAEAAALDMMRTPSPSPVEEDGEVTLTEAELALYAAKGATVAISNAEGRFESENPYELSSGGELFRIGQGQEQFTGKLLYKSEDDEKIILWHAVTGARTALPKVHLLYYLGKGCWLTRPPANSPDLMPDMKCPVPGCKKRGKFYTAEDVEAHVKAAHNAYWKSLKAQRERARADKLDKLLDIAAGGMGNGPSMGGDANTVLLLQIAELLREALGTTEAAPERSIVVDQAPPIDAEPEPVGAA